MRSALLGILLMALGAPGHLTSRAAPLAHASTEAPAGRLYASLARALAAGDRGQLSRLGATAGARGLGPALTATNRTVILAAVLASPAAADSWALLELLARHAAGPDRIVSAAAAIAAAQIASRLDRDWELTYEAHEISGDAVAHWQHIWWAIGADSGRWSDVRVHALEVSTHLAAVRSRQRSQPPAPGLSAAGAAHGLAALAAADADAEVRRAAFELLPHPLTPDERAIAARAVAGDADPAAALAAAQALCSELTLGKPPAPVLAALGPAGLDRLRRLVTDGSLAPGARLDGARCLAADRAPESRRALESLQSSLPGRIRGQVEHLLPAPR